MKIVGLAVLIMILLSVGMLTGCHDMHARWAGPNVQKREQFVLESSQTGLPYSKVIYGELDQDG